MYGARAELRSRFLVHPCPENVHVDLWAEGRLDGYKFSRTLLHYLFSSAIHRTLMIWQF